VDVNGEAYGLKKKQLEVVIVGWHAITLEAEIIIVYISIHFFLCEIDKSLIGLG
jgi:hypothetical protein